MPPKTPMSITVCVEGMQRTLTLRAPFTAAPADVLQLLFEDVVMEVLGPSHMVIVTARDTRVTVMPTRSAAADVLRKG